jgi:EpsI family protein
LTSPAAPPTPDTATRQITRRSALIAAAFASTAGIAAAVTPHRHEAMIGGARLTEVVPHSVGPWRSTPGGSIILPETDEPSNFYDQVLTRTYTASGLPGIMLLIAYGAAQSGMMKVHRPEVCYASAGFAIKDFDHVAVPLGHNGSIPASAFLAKREDRDEQVLYWTRISNRFPTSLTAQRVIVLERGLSGVIPDGVLVRFSTLGAAPNGRAAVIRFAQALVDTANRAEASLLVGGPSLMAQT